MKKLLKRKGFTLVECIVAIAIFALMSALVMQILALSIRQYRSNHHVETDMDAQIQNIATDNGLLERETTDIAIEFVKDGGAGGTVGKIEVNDVAIMKNPDNATGSDRLEINTFDAVIKPNTNNKDKTTGGMITDDIHCYGAKDIDYIYISATETESVNSLKKIELSVKINDPDKILNSAECNAVKFALPGSAKNISISVGESGLGYLRLSKGDSINYRFYDSKINDKVCGEYEFKIVFFMKTSDKDAENDYKNDYGSFAKYFIAPDSTEAVNEGTFNDDVTPGIYNNR